MKIDVNNPDLSKLTLNELVELEKKLVAEIPHRQAEERRKVVQELKQLAVDRGFDLHDLIGSAKAVKQPRAPVAVKYRSGPGQEWTGRGRKPAWVVAHLASGGKLEDLAA
ncbi:H-NS histone family protein [Chitinimonas sp. JJ19]|uniref:H-NS histone family protein n=1 Tax=Chitinimonas sp. JJ19 TaxID=3109352 RepID=UPI003003A551